MTGNQTEKNIHNSDDNNNNNNNNNNNSKQIPYLNLIELYTA